MRRPPVDFDRFPNDMATAGRGLEKAFYSIMEGDFFEAISELLATHPFRCPRAND